MIVGFIMIFLSFRFKSAEVFNLGNEEEEASDSTNEISEFKNTAFTVLLIVSVIGVILGGCGVSLMFIKNRGCAVLFGCTLLPIWIIMFVFGIVIAVFSNSSKSTIIQFCDNVDMNSDYIENIRDMVGDVDDFLGEAISQKMCSDICPCPDDGSSDPWFEMEEATLNSYGRTKNLFST